MERGVRLARVLPGLVLLTFLVGCAHREFAPGQRVLFVHEELPAATRAVESARAVGKDRQCPPAFQEAEGLKDQAWTTYWACNTAEAIRLANEAVAKANALCPPPVAAPPPRAATVTLSANPATIVQGQCATLTWSSTNATGVSLAPGVGSVDPSGSRQVCPASTTQYTIAATGPGGRGTAAATVAVTPPPTPAAAPAPRVVDRLTIQLHFDFDKATIGPAGQAELEKAVAFVKRYPGAKVSIAGHTDSTGTDEYNMGLSQRRATAVKDYLVKQGAADAQRITTVGYGETRPIASNATPEGRTQNRRAEILILSE
jgi:OmpA-OmpF porin, OOP family